MLNLAAVHESAPSVVRGVACSFGTGSCAGEIALAYGSGTLAVLRSVANPTNIIKSFGHSHKVTAVRLSPCGRLCASADEAGNLRVWNTDPSSTASAKEFQPLSAPIRDVSWSHDSERIVVAGEGRSTRAVVINAQMGTTMGELAGITGDITSCDFRKDRPFRIAAGSSDSMVGFYEGPPFKFMNSVKNEHKAKVNCVRYSPDSSVVASVSGASSILLQDGKTGEVVRKIETTHTGTIYALAWSTDGTYLATASADKTVRCWATADGSCKFSATMGNTVRDMQLGVACVPSGWVAINLAGDLTFIDVDGGATRTVRGFDKSVKALRADADGTLVAANFEGRVLAFPSTGDAIPYTGKEPSFVEGGASCGTGMMLWTGERAVFAAAATKTLEQSLETKALLGAALGDDAFVAAAGTSLVVFRNGKEVAKASLPKRASAIAAAATSVAVATDSGVCLFTVAGDSIAATVTIDAQPAHRSDISAIAISADGSRIATGDTTQIIAVWNAATGEAVHTELGFHRSRINCLSFAPASTNLLASGGNDNAIIVWNLEGKTHHKVANAHNGPVTALVFMPDGTLASGGHDGCVKRWNIGA
uniref:Guanine nucleotide-binding protein subunit beta-like protein n=1 Tax=Neobodo designis TaxID=312471 RepID=A0A7S1MLU9_NEODS